MEILSVFSQDSESRIDTYSVVSDNTPEITKIRLLLIDDEPDILEISRLFLHKYGDFIVTTEQDSRRAVNLDLEEFDIIVSDYDMPYMSGLDLLQHLKSRGIIIPFVLLTGMGNDSVMYDAIRIGAASYLQKTMIPSIMFADLAAIVQIKISHLNKKKIFQIHSSAHQGKRSYPKYPEPAPAVDPDGLTFMV